MNHHKCYGCYMAIIATDFPPFIIAADGMTAGCQSNIYRTLDLHCCLTCSLQRSWLGGCKVSQAPLQSAQLLAAPELAQGFCCQEQSLQLCVPKRFQFLGPYLQRQIILKYVASKILFLQSLLVAHVQMQEKQV